MTDLRPIYFNEARARLVGNRLAVYDALMAHGPATGSELSKVMGWQVTSCRPRLTEMSPGHAEKYGIPVAVITTGIRRNGEHEFRALTAAQMQAAHEAKRYTVAQVTIDNAKQDGPAADGPATFTATFRELKQMEIFA